MRIILKIICVFWGGTVPALALANPPAHVAIEALRAANEARSTNTKEQSDWNAESERLRLLLKSVRQEVEQLKAQEAATQESIVTLEQKKRALVPKEQKQTDIETLALELIAQIHGTLDQIGQKALPGVIPPKQKRDASVLERLKDALKRMEDAERNAAGRSVEVVTGTLNGNALTVELLRLGGVSAWWRSLDGQKTGAAWVESGQILLQELTSTDERRAISDAIAIAKGRAPPKLVILPFAHAPRKASAQR